jgi:hypothetical protein
MIERPKRVVAERAPGGAETQDGLDHVTVIPAYREGYGILRMLRSLVEQENMAGISHAIFININQAPDEPDATADNMRTYTLLQCLRSKQKITLRTDEAVDEDARKRVRVMNEWIKEIQASDLEINIIDTFSEGQAIAGNNVGIARDVGVRSAAAYLASEEGVVTVSDADAWLSPQYISQAIKWLQEAEDDLISPRFEFMVEGLSKSEREAYFDRCIVDNARSAALSMHYRTVRRALAAADAAQRAVYIRGAGMSTTWKTYQRAGGYPPLSGAEDVALGMEAMRRGLHVSTPYKHIAVYAVPRISERVDADHGHGHSMLQWANNDQFGTQEIMTHKGLVAYYNTLDAICLQHASSVAQSNQPLDRQAFASVTQSTLHASGAEATEEDVEGLWRAYAEWQDLDNAYNNITLQNAVRTLLSSPQFGYMKSVAEDLPELEAVAARFSHDVVEPRLGALGEPPLPLTWEQFEADMLQSAQRYYAPEADHASLDARVRLLAVYAFVVTHYPPGVAGPYLQLPGGGTSPETTELVRRFARAEAEHFRLLARIGFWAWLRRVPGVALPQRTGDADALREVHSEMRSVIRALRRSPDMPQDLLGRLVRYETALLDE